MRVNRREMVLGAAAAVAGIRPSLALGGSPSPVERPLWATYFKEAGTTGVVCFAHGGGILTSDPARASRLYVPASTFKIANALIALETGVASPDERFEWDGVERGLSGKPIDAWNQSQTLRDAFRNSTIWVYQDVARRIGSERMARLVAAFDYGTKDIAGAPIDKFWLVSQSHLRISALQQIAFLQQLWAGTLPVKPENMATVRDMMLLEREAGHALFGKTGWGDDIGWLVGVLEHGGKPHAFALNLDHDGSDAVAKQRLAIVKRAAQDLELL